LNGLVEIITREVKNQGAISFARFMELALYCPVCGYYEKEADSVGRRGDYYTSVSTGSLFGELLAFQFADWLERLKTQHSALTIVEAGAHNGQLAQDILSWLQTWRPALFETIEYWIIEPSSRRQGWQAERLEKLAARVRWLADLETAATRNSQLVSQDPKLSGIVFANELLDAMPVRRLGWNAKERRWFEWGVAVAGRRFVWAKLEIRNSKLETPNLPSALLDILPDGFTTEISPAAESWWRAAAGRLRAGRLLTLDYGLAMEEFFAPSRREGTLRAYHRHHLAGDLLANAGEQDLTAHINFTALQAAGEAAGLKTEALVTQAGFLTGIAGRIWKAPSAFGEWTAARARQFQTLTHPEHLGLAFRVLIQSC